MSLKNSSRTPFRLVLSENLSALSSTSADGSPDKIILDRDGKEIGDLYVTWEEAEEIVNAINLGLYLVSSGRTEAQGG